MGLNPVIVQILCMAERVLNLSHVKVSQDYKSQDMISVLKSHEAKHTVPYHNKKIPTCDISPEKRTVLM